MQFRSSPTARPRPSSSRLRAFACVALLLALSPRAVRADERSEAEALVDRGVELRRSADDEGALALFTQAYDRAPSPRARAQMALAEQALGHFVEAEAHLLEALAATDDEWIARRRSDLQVALEAIQHRLGYLELRGGIDGSEVRIDGRSVGRLPMEAPLRLVTGGYRVEVVARGYYPLARIVTIVSDATTRELLAMTPLPEPPPSTEVATPVAQARDADGSRRRRHAIGGSLLGVGVGALAASLASYLVREDRAQAYNADACLAGGGTRGENCGDLYDEAIRAGRASYAMLGLGVASAGVGTWLLVTGPRRREAPRGSSLACGLGAGTRWEGRCRLRF